MELNKKGHILIIERISSVILKMQNFLALLQLSEEHSVEMWTENRVGNENSLPNSCKTWVATNSSKTLLASLTVFFCLNCNLS